MNTPGSYRCDCYPGFTVSNKSCIGRWAFTTENLMESEGGGEGGCYAYAPSLFFLIVCFTSYFVFRIAVLPHSSGVVYYHLLLRLETRIPRVAPFSFRIGIWDLFVPRGQKSYTPTAFVKLWIRSKMHETCLIIIHDPGMRPGPESNRGPLD